MMRQTAVLKQHGDASTGFTNTHGPMRTINGWGTVMLPPTYNMALITTSDNTLVFYIIDGSMLAQLGDSLSKATNIVVSRGWIVRVQPKNSIGFRNRSLTHFAVAFYVYRASS
jgi:hypothetical protein